VSQVCRAAYWGGRYNAAVKRLMLVHAFRFVEPVVFLTGSTNLRFQRAVEKIGGRRTATVVREDLESIVFEIVRDHWRSG
jgi:N-acetyltransferase